MTTTHRVSYAAPVASAARATPAASSAAKVRHAIAGGKEGVERTIRAIDNTRFAVAPSAATLARLKAERSALSLSLKGVKAMDARVLQIDRTLKRATLSPEASAALTLEKSVINLVKKAYVPAQALANADMLPTIHSPAVQIQITTAKAWVGGFNDLAKTAEEARKVLQVTRYSSPGARMQAEVRAKVLETAVGGVAGLQAEKRRVDRLLKGTSHEPIPGLTLERDALAGLLKALAPFKS